MTEQEMNQAAEEPIREEGETIMDAFVRYQKTALKESAAAIEALIPEGFKTHSREARKAFLMSFKVVLESVAAKVEEAAEAVNDESQASTTGKTKVRVEVS